MGGPIEPERPIEEALDDPVSSLLRHTLLMEQHDAAKCSHFDRITIDANAAFFLVEKQLAALRSEGYTIVPPTHPERVRRLWEDRHGA